MTAITSDARKLVSRRWLAHYQQSVRSWLLGAVMAGVLQTLAIIGQMGLFAWLAQAILISGQELSHTWPALALLLACILLRALALLAQELCAQQASARVRQQMRSDLTQRWAALGPVRLAGESSARLANQWLEQVDAVDGYYARYLPQQWLALLAPLLILALVLWLDWLAAIFLLLSAPLIPLFMALVGMQAEQISQRHVLQAGRLAGHFLDRIRNLTSLQLFGQQRVATASVQAHTQAYRQLSMATLKVAFLSSAVLEFFASVAIAVVAMYIGFGLLGYIEYGPAEQLTLFSGLFVLLLAPEFFQPLRSLAQHYHDRAAALGAADQLAEWQTQQPSEHPIELQAPDSASPDAVCVTDLTLAHPDRPPVLRQANLHLPRGQALLISGPSGIGKTTLLQCLAGFIAPQQGQISVFAHAPGTHPIAWLGQRPWLIKGSWADNLRLLTPAATEEQMRAALEKVGLAESLQAQTAGLNSQLGEDGRGLSGGQAQRLALARVWLSSASLVLLDEPTAGLDADSEQGVVYALRALRDSGRTLIIVSHHPAMSELADQHLYLSNGVLAHA
ncbi:thiol reductant ABC exporter subunit CydD [Halopseudomonas salegens]|uniref:ATP-binding cassette, subfamily C, CydD n=1 Tax=Halopseudomonas salegens TaxID=1434072 RepID=A0A1H2HIN3_9GAMM|nr:thiol reductant ABC exporter subunit CydD [Halopseudomonas salegens]SDU31408.1 ATP-binding cassette, subfamily C, CydD [Halopseudomonas salegens]